MKSVFQLLNLPQPVEGDVGIEIEAEGHNMQEVHNAYWGTEADGSLRGGYPECAAEFVLKKPIPIGKVREAVQSLKMALKDAEFDFSFRTSVHVHVNVQALTEAQVMNFIYLYLLFEEPLVNYCGRQRKGNRFCLRVQDAEGLIGILAKGAKEGLRPLMNVHANDIRYSAMNIAAMAKYGSIEFRAMRGNLDEETIVNWATILVSLREKAKEYKSPKDILDEFLRVGPVGYLMQVFGDLAEEFSYPRMAREMQRSYSLSLDIPHLYKEPVDDPEMDKQRRMQELYGIGGVKDHRIINGRLQLYHAREWIDWRLANAQDYQNLGMEQPIKRPVNRRPVMN